MPNLWLGQSGLGQTGWEQTRWGRSGSGSSGLALVARPRNTRRRSGRLFLGKVLLGLLAAACCLAPLAHAQRASRRGLAIQYYRQALDIQEKFEKIPLEERDAKDYQRVIEAFRRVYWTDPSYGNDTICLMAIGALYEEMGQRWEREAALEAAVEAYSFLVREYLGSKFRRQASLAIARIYRDDLKRPAEAMRQYEKFVADNPGAPELKDAVQAMEEIQAAEKALEAEAQLASENKREETEPAASAEPAAAPAAETSDNLALVSGVRHWVTPDYTRLVIDVGKDVKYGIGRVGNPPRVYVDLFGSRPAPEITNQTFAVENGLLKGVKTGRHTANVTRVVLYVGDLTEYSVFELPNPYRVVVDIRDREGPAAAGAELVSRATAPEPKEPEPPAPPPVMAAKSPAAPPTVAVEEPKSSEKAEETERAEPVEVAEVADGPVFEKVEAAQPNLDGTRSLTRALGLKISKILIDPGHGGSDTGTIGPSGYQEKDLVLDIAKRLGKLIEEQLGSEVVFTRQDDSFVPLETRTAVANQQEADLFLSIHANSSRSPRARGVETYYLNFTTDADALEVAARENAISQERISQLQGLVKKIALAEKVDESREFANHVQAKVWKTQAVLNRKVADRGVKKAPFVVLIGANMPSALAEVAFLSNPAEEKLLKTESHRQKIAEALYSGIVAYVETLSVVKVAER